LAMSCLFVVLSFSSCCVPCVVITMIRTFEFPTIGVDSGIIVKHWSNAFLFLNSSLNSIVFFWRNKLLRKESFKLIKR
jgi:hypothetical protein